MSSTMIKEKAVLDIEPIVNVGIRTAVLVLLCCQNAGHALLTRYSQGEKDTSFFPSKYATRATSRTVPIS